MRVDASVRHVRDVVRSPLERVVRVEEKAAFGMCCRCVVWRCDVVCLVVADVDEADLGLRVLRAQRPLPGAALDRVDDLDVVFALDVVKQTLDFELHYRVEILAQEKKSVVLAIDLPIIG